MRTLFADTFYWIALANSKDQWHKKAQALSKSLGQFRIITTDEVLTEFVTQFGSFGPEFRAKAVQLVHSILFNPNIQVIQQSRDSFRFGLNLYHARPNRAYTLTDCISMNTMKDENVNDVLTYDEHFEQEQFQALFRKSNQ